MVSTFSQGNIVPVVIIIALTVLFYYETLQIPFIGPDWFDFAVNEATRDTFYRESGDPRILKHVFQDLLHSIFGLNPLPYHVVSLITHCVNSILVFYIVKRVNNNGLAGLLAALLFASFWSHPETVIPMFKLHDTIEAVFVFSCVILFYRYRTHISKKSTNYVLALGAYILAVGFKERSAFIMVPMMYLIDMYVQLESEEGLVDARLNKDVYIPFILWPILWLLPWISAESSDVHTAYIGIIDKWTQWPINFYLTTTNCFNLCFLKGPGYGTLVLALVLLCLPILDIKLRKKIILMGLAWLVSLWPLILIGMHPMYLYLPSAFGVAIFTTCVYHLIAYVIRRFRLKEAYVTALTILIASVFVSTNFFHVKRQIQYYQDMGRVSEAFWKTMLSSFPTNALDTRLVFINLPWVYKPASDQGYIAAHHDIWIRPLWTMFAAVYGMHNIGPIHEYTLLERNKIWGWFEKHNIVPVYEYTFPDLYNGRHPIIQSEESKLSPEEFEKLAMEKDTRVYIFNPGNDTVLDVTGRDYNSIRELISKN